MTQDGWSYGYKGEKETRSVLITKPVAEHLGLPRGTVITFTGPDVRTAEDMSPAGIAALEDEYGCRVNGRYEWGLA